MPFWGHPFNIITKILFHTHTFRNSFALYITFKIRKMKTLLLSVSNAGYHSPTYCLVPWSKELERLVKSMISAMR